MQAFSVGPSRVFARVFSLAIGIALNITPFADAAALCGWVNDDIVVQGGLETHTFTEDGTSNPVSASFTVLTPSSSGGAEYFDGTWKPMPSVGSASGSAVRFDDGSGAVIRADFGHCDVEIQDSDT